MPTVVETHRKFAARGYETVAVAVWRDDPRRVREFTKALPFKVALDTGAPDWERLHELVERELGA